MSEFEMKKLEMDFRTYTSRNFERPTDCQDADKIRFYLTELSTKIEEYETRFQYVPTWAYTLLAQYNIAHNRVVQAHFKQAYL
jgi:hypothetical protein